MSVAPKQDWSKVETRLISKKEKIETIYHKKTPWYNKFGGGRSNKSKII